MTGRELIKYIQENHAEDMLVCVQFRDAGGLYNGADDATPLMGRVTKIEGLEEYGYNEYDVSYAHRTPNAVIL